MFVGSGHGPPDGPRRAPALLDPSARGEVKTPSREEEQNARPESYFTPGASRSQPAISPMRVVLTRGWLQNTHNLSKGQAYRSGMIVSELRVVSPAICAVVVVRAQRVSSPVAVVRRFVSAFIEFKRVDHPRPRAR